jgi:methenyltetrahydrofolate cyclohydrolase
VSRDRTADLSLQELLGEVADRTPAPGGGAAVAWTVALAAALTEMGAHFGDGGRLAEVASRAALLRARALELADMDAIAYGAVLSTSGDSRAAALSAAADPPLLMARAAAEVAALAAEVVAAGNPNLVGDAAAGAVLAEAACSAAAHLVEIDLAPAPNDPRLAEVRAAVEAAVTARARAQGGPP